MQNEEDIPYRSAASVGPIERVSNEDVDDLPTLKAVQTELHKALDEIDAIHVFDLTEKGGLTVKQQIAAYKKAREILEPHVSRVDSVVSEINLKYK